MLPQAVFTLLPVRFAYAVFTAARDCLAARFAVRPRHAPDPPAPQQQQQRPVQERHTRSQRRRQQQQQPANDRPHRSTEGPSDGSSSTVDSSSSSGPAAGGGVRPQLRGDQLYDLLGVLIFLGTVLFLWHLNAGVLYFWMKDLTQEFLKLSVLFTALELADKVGGGREVAARVVLVWLGKGRQSRPRRGAACRQGGLEPAAWNLAA